MTNPTTNRLSTIGERISRLVQDSLDELYLLRQEEAESLKLVRERSCALNQEFQDVAVAVDRALEEYDRLRKALLEGSRLGVPAGEKMLYDRTTDAMAMRNSLGERHRFLLAQKASLTNEERRLERSVARSDSMGNRLRMVLNLLTAPENTLSADAASSFHSAEAISTALQIVDREAMALARELHDGATQTFSAVGLILEIIAALLEKENYEGARQELDHALTQTRNGLNELRAILFSLSPTGIQEGFELPLRRLASQLHQMRGCILNYTLTGEFGDVPMNMRIGAFKTLHQAVLNAVLHGATEVRVSVRYAKRILEARVLDNGNGFDVEREREAGKERGSYGLQNMEERVRMLGGTLTISSVLKEGSNVAFSIPVREEIIRPAPSNARV